MRVAKRRECIKGRGKARLCSLFLLPLLTGASATGPAPLGWDAAVREAVMWHPSVGEWTDRLKARGEDVEIAKAGYRPQVSAGFGSSFENTLRSNWRPRATISASQMLFDFGKVASDVALAQAGTRKGRADLLFAVDSLIRDTGYSLIEIQRVRVLREVALEQLASVEAITKLVDHRYRLGATTKSDALQAKARVQAADVTLLEIEAERRRWDSNLSYLLGRPTAPEIAMAFPDGVEDACSRGEPDWTIVPAYLQVEAARAEALASYRRARADGMPTISVGAGGGAALDDPFSRRADYNIGLRVSSPLYSGGAQRARARGAGHSLAASDAAEARVRNEVSRLLAEAQRQLSSLDGVVETLTERQAAMDETGKLYRLQYLDMGTRTLIDLLNAERELHQARFDLVNTRFDIRRLQLDCLYNSGRQREVFGLNGLVIRGVTL